MSALISVFLCPGALKAEPPVLDPAQAIRGQQLFLDTCAACHGDEALGESGPDIQGSTLHDVETAIRGIDQMPEIWLDEGEPKAIATFLMSLNPKIAEIKLRHEQMMAN
nr:c-type cytochrome [uncultured Celeribacter sp.]